LAALSVVVALLMVGACGSTQSGPTVPAHAPGTVADDGFRPDSNGLPFVNYGNVLSSGVVPDNMTAADVQKMF
jgi:hypothetical protein